MVKNEIMKNLAKYFFIGAKYLSCERHNSKCLKFLVCFLLLNFPSNIMQNAHPLAQIPLWGNDVKTPMGEVAKDLRAIMHAPPRYVRYLSQAFDELTANQMMFLTQISIAMIE